MTTRTLLLTVHIACAAGWLGADFIVHALTARVRSESSEVQAGWARQLAWMHERYYAAVVVLLLLSGILLVLDGGWSWSSGFIWVGVGAIVVGASLGGGGLGRLAKEQVAAFEAGDLPAVEHARRRMVPISVVVTLAPLVAILAMVDKWRV